MQRIDFIIVTTSLLNLACGSIMPHKVTDEERNQKLKKWDVSFSFGEQAAITASSYEYSEPCSFSDNSLIAQMTEGAGPGIDFTINDFPKTSFDLGETVSVERTENLKVKFTNREFRGYTQEYSYTKYPTKCLFEAKKIDSRHMSGTVACENLMYIHGDRIQASGKFSCTY